MHKKVDITSGEFRAALHGGPLRRAVMSVSLDQDLIKELSNFVAAAFEVLVGCGWPPASENSYICGIENDQC